MQITKCDICKKVMKKGSEKLDISISGPDFRFSSFDICAGCGRSVKKFLTKNKLVKEK